jgi:hypothetical protein
MISTNGCDLPFYGLGFVDMKGKCLDIKLESFSSVTWEDWRLFLTYVTILTNLGNSFSFSSKVIPPLCDFPSQLLWMYVETHLNNFSPWRYHGYRIGVCSFTSLSHPCWGLVLGSSFLFFPPQLEFRQSRVTSNVLWPKQGWSSSFSSLCQPTNGVSRSRGRNFGKVKE